MDSYLLAEAIGGLALVLAFSFHQIKQPRLSILALCIPSMLWVTHFSLLGGVSGMIMSSVALCRNISATLLPQRFSSHAIILFISIGISFVLYFAEHITDLTPIAAAVLIGTAALKRDHPVQYRLCYMSGELIWAAYGFVIGSTSLIIASTLLASSVLISLVRHNILPNIKPRQAQPHAAE